MGAEASGEVVETGVADEKAVQEYFGKDFAGCKIVLSKQVFALRDEVVKVRRHLHANPELSKQEKQTNAYIVKYLRNLPDTCKVTIQSDRVGGYGVVALIQGEKGPGPCVMIRADIDALPVREENDLPFKSRKEGVMHACGHDCHTSIALVATRVLSQLTRFMKGSVKVIFQPAEEAGFGGPAMVKDGVMRDPKPDVVYGLHVWASEACGNVICSPNAMMAGSNTFEISVKGRGGHGAMPQTCVDPVIAASQLVLNLHSNIVGRTVSPLKTAVLTVGTFNCGSKNNVIPSDCRLTGTIRFFDDEVGDLMKTRITEVCSGVGIANGVKVDLAFGESNTLGACSTLAVINDQTAHESVKKVCSEILSEGMFIEREKVTMAAEDFSAFLNGFPGAFFFLGCGNREVSESERTSHHDCGFFVDERCLPIGVQLMCSLCLEHVI